MCMLFILVVLGHFVGDYILQPVWMALGKSARTWKGFGVCLAHCLVYSGAVAVLAANATNPWLWAVAFASHFPIDRWSLGQKWLDLIGGRNVMTDWDKVVADRRKGMPAGHLGPEDFHIPVVVTAFAAVVYTVVDNTFHILALFAGLVILRANGLV